MLDAERGTEHVDLEHLADVVRIQVHDQAGDLDPGVVDQDVQAAEFADRVGDGQLPARVVGHVEREEGGGGAGLFQFVGGGLAEVFPDIADDDGRSGPG